MKPSGNDSGPPKDKLGVVPLVLLSRRNTMDIHPEEAGLTFLFETSVKTLNQTSSPSVTSKASSSTVYTSDSSSSNDLPEPGSKPQASKQPTPKTAVFKKLYHLHQVASRKTNRLIQQAEPTMTHIQEEMSERVEPILSYVDRLVLTRINTYLHRAIVAANHYVMLAGDWLNQNLPGRVLKWFTPIPDDEKEHFEIHKPSGLSMCFFALNLALLVVGMFVFMVGVLTLTDPQKLSFLSSFDPTDRLKKFNFGGFLANVSFALLVFGFFLLAMGYLGTLGCILGQRQMLRAYASIVMLAIAIQALGVILFLLLRKPIYNSIAKQLKESVKKNYDGMANSSSAFSQLVDVIQIYFDCCGVESFKDFKETKWYKTANPDYARYKVPITCCKRLEGYSSDLKPEDQLVHKRCQTKPPSLKNPNTMKPCLKTISNWLIGQVFVIAGAVFTLVGLQVSAITNAKAIESMIHKKFAKRRKARQKEEEKSGSFFFG